METSSANTSAKPKSRKELRKQRKKSKQRGSQCSTKDGSAVTENSISAHESAQARDLAEKWEQRRRLDDIVKDHIDDLLIVYDKPSATDTENSYLMSGALMTEELEAVNASSPDAQEQSAASSISPSPLSSLSDSSSYVDMNITGSMDDNLGEDSEDEDEDDGVAVETTSSGSPGDDSEIKDPSDGEIFTSLADSPVQETERASWTDRSQESEEPVFANPFVQSSPTLHIKKAQRLRSNTTPLPVPIEGPRLPNFAPRVVPGISPSFRPTTPEFTRSAIVSGKEKDEEAHGLYRADSSDRPRNEAPIPAPEP
ncbi:hypothetical protein F4779DRAFT_618174 [Xylariaceae sp. FL0662B]|nr:hypothetical protein F4779DRAFT_618174 [Xylariaceae sp. FL0662B]